MATNRIDRREWMQMTLGAAAALSLPSRLLGESKAAALIRRAIPSTGEKLPVVGLGSSATFSQAARGENSGALREVIKAMVDRGASVIDTAPSYGASEQVAGDIASELGVTSKIFWATKVNVAGRGSDTKADPAAARVQIESSFAKLKVSKIDLIQVHNLADVPTHLGILKELKKSGRVRYIGVTTTSKGQYATLQDTQKEDALKPFASRIRDAILSYIRVLSFEDAVDGGHMEKLRAEMLERCHSAGATGAARILITDLVIQ